MRQVFVVLAGALIAACGGRYGKASPAAPGSGAPRGVEAAALPYRIVDARSGREVDEADFWAALGRARVVCVGEEHPNPHDHWAQLQVVDRLSKRMPPAALGLEMVQRPFQGVLDDWAARRIDDAALLSRTGWEERWGYDFGLYRPMLARVAERSGSLVALNVSREISKKVSREGLAALSAADRAGLPEIVLDDAAHRAWFDGVMAAMGGHGHGSDDSEPSDPAAEKAAADRIYSVQVLWDETMADGAARWLAAGGDRAMIILAGNGHCHDTGIIGRLKRRGVEGVSIRPIIDDGKGNVASVLAERINDYLFVMSMGTP